MENNSKPEISREFIKKTAEFRKHRKQAFWQIYFPLIIVLIITIAIIVLAVMTAAQGDTEGINSKWASLTLIVIILMSSVFALVFAGIFYGSVYLLAKGIRKTPEIGFQVQHIINLVGDKTIEIMNAIAVPIVKIGGVAQSINKLNDLIRGKNRKNRKVN